MKNNLRVSNIKNFLFKDNNKTLIIAEIGTNHNGDFYLAKKMIAKAAKCGVDAVKFQTFKTEKYFTRRVPAFPRAKLLGYETQFDRFKDLEFNNEQIFELYEISKKNKVFFLSTPFDNDTVDFLNPLVKGFKIASADLINIQLLRYIASKKKPVILSTGQASVEEIDEAVKIFHNDQLALMYCVSAYPTPDDQANLRSIPFLSSRYNLPVGYSDHTIGILACISAVALGAKIIEKHFTFDKSQKFGDHTLSADPDDMKLLVSEIRRLEKMLGKEEKKSQKCEQESKRQLRRSLHLKCDIKRGTVLQEDMLIPLVSGIGILANRLDEVLGKKVLHDLKKSEALKETDIF